MAEVLDDSFHIGDATSISKVSESICPGVASASLCIRESRVRGDMGNRSLVFPEFVGVTQMNFVFK